MAPSLIVKGVAVVALVTGFTGRGLSAAENTPAEKAITEIEKLGGRITRDEKNPGRPVIALMISNAKFTDAELLLVKRLPQIQRLSLLGTQVTDAGLKHLKGFTQLQRLRLWDSKITDSGLADLTGLPQLQELTLGRVQIAGAGLVHLHGLTQLRRLSLEYCSKITGAGLEQLQGLPQLQVLDLSRCLQVTDSGLEHVKELRQLQTLYLGGTRVTDAGLEHLKGLTKLQTLMVGGRVTRTGLQTLQTALPTLQVVGQPYPNDPAMDLEIAGEGAEIDKLKTTLRSLPAPPAKPRAESLIPAPATDPQVERFQPLDIQPVVNMKFTENVGIAGHRLDNLPLGHQVLGGVRFLIEGGFIQLGSQRLSEKPERVTGIKIEKYCAKLHFLHSAHVAAQHGAWVGWYTVHYEDGTRNIVPIRYGLDTFGSRDLSKSAWGGVLFVTSWSNPKAAQKVVTLDFSSTLQIHSAPYCVAISFEQSDGVATKQTSAPTEKADEQQIQDAIHQLVWLSQVGTSTARMDTAQPLIGYGRHSLGSLFSWLTAPDPDVQLIIMELIRKHRADLVVHGDFLLDLESRPDRPAIDRGLVDPRFAERPGDPNSRYLGGFNALKTALLRVRSQSTDELVRTAAEETWRTLEFPPGLESLRVICGPGTPIAEHPRAKCRIANGTLQDAQGKVLATLTAGRSESVASWSFSPDGEWLAVGIRNDNPSPRWGGTTKGLLRLFKTDTGEAVGHVGAQTPRFGPVEAVSFSADGKTLQYQVGQYKVSKGWEKDGGK
jgi:hypothetical protein